MIPKVVFLIIVIGVAIAARNLPVVFAADMKVMVNSEVMTPGMSLNPEKLELQTGDTVTWVNLTGRGIKLIPDWEEAAPLPPRVQDGGTVHLKFDRPGKYGYSVFPATDRFEQDIVPLKISGVVVVNPRPSRQ